MCQTIPNNNNKQTKNKIKIKIKTPMGCTLFLRVLCQMDERYASFELFGGVGG